jgi:hypothetical protein
VKLADYKPEAVLISVALVALGLGLVVYLTDRGGSAQFIPVWLAAELPRLRLFGVLGGCLPTFVHVIAFALLTGVALGPGPQRALIASVGWVVVNTLFELGQVDGVARAMSGSGLIGSWMPAAALGYFRSGTFAAGDLGAAGMGGLVAYTILTIRETRVVQCTHA